MGKKRGRLIRRIDREARSRQSGLRGLLHWWLENDRNPHKWVLDLVLVVFITSSLVIIVWQTTIEPRVEPRLGFANVALLLVFAAEYVLRLLVATDFLADWRDHGFLRAVRRKVRWMLRLTSIIDFLAILPSTEALRALRVLRLLRVARMLRTLKLAPLIKYARYTSSLSEYKEEFRKRRDEISVLAFASVAVILFSSVAVFCIEKPNGNESITSFVDAVWWSIVTCTTVGYGDIYPITVSGRVIASILMLTGIATVGGSGAIVTSVIMARVDEVKSGRRLNVKPSDHVLFCGWTKSAQRVAQSLDALGFLDSTMLVVLSDGERPREDYCRYYRGNVTSRADLMAVAVEKARHAVVFNDPDAGVNIEQADRVATMIALQITSLNPNCHVVIELNDDASLSFINEHLPSAEVIRKEGLDAEVILNTVRNAGHTSEILCDLSDFNTNRVRGRRFSEFMEGKGEGITVRDVKQQLGDSGKQCVFLGYLSGDGVHPVLNPTNDELLPPDPVVYCVESVDEIS